MMPASGFDPRVPRSRPRPVYWWVVVFPLGLSAGVTAAIVLAACAVVIVVVIVIAPWRTVRDEPPIPEDVETRLLLGEDFEQVEEELTDDQRASGSSILELDRTDRPE